MIGLLQRKVRLHSSIVSGQVGVLESDFVFPDPALLRQMSHLSSRNRRNTLHILTRIVLLLVVAQSLISTVVAADDIDEPKPYLKCWHRDASLDVSAGAVGDGLNVYYFTTNNTLEAAEIKNGSKVWSTDFGGSVVSNLLLTDSAVIFVTAAGSENGAPSSAKSVVRAVSKQTGITAWIANVPSSAATTLGIIDNKIVAVNEDGNITAFVRETGSLAASQAVGASIVAEPLFGERLTLATEANNLIGVDIKTGAVKTLLRGSRPVSAVLVDSDGRMLVGDDRGNIFLTSADGDRMWTFKNGARTSFLMHYDSEFIAGSQDNFIYKLTRRGGVEWKRRLSGRVSSRPLIVGNDAIVSSTGDSNVYVIDLRNGKIVNRIEMGGDENIATRVAAGGSTGFVLVSSNGLSSFDRETCPAK